jgi:hypothetical protein
MRLAIMISRNYYERANVANILAYIFKKINALWRTKLIIKNIASQYNNKTMSRIFSILQKLKKLLKNHIIF